MSDWDLCLAAVRGDVKEVTRLLVAGVSVNSGVDKWTPLFYAAMGGNTEVTGVLLGYGADITQCAPDGNTMLHTAAGRGNLEVTKMLLKTNLQGQTPLQAACHFQHEDVAAVLRDAEERAYSGVAQQLQDFRIDESVDGEVYGSFGCERIRVAVKEAKYDPSLREDDVLTSHAMLELDILKRVPRHENVVHFFTHQEPIRGVLRFYTEECNLGDLYTYTKGKQFDKAKKARMMVQLADGLAHLHAQSPPVILRDIKPETILMSSVHGRPTIKWADLGCSKPLEASRSATADTTAFHAPEIDKTRRHTDIRADVYSAGLVMAALFIHPAVDHMRPVIEGEGFVKCIGRKMKRLAEHKLHTPPLFFLKHTDDWLDTNLKHIICALTAYIPTYRITMAKAAAQLKRVQTPP